MVALLTSVCFLPTAGSTTDWTYSSAIQGYNSPAQGNVQNGETYCYRAESSDLIQWEIGTGTYTTSTGVLTRSTVLYNSSGTGTAAGQSGAGTKISFSAAPRVAITATAFELPSLTARNVYTDTTASTSSTTGSATFAGGVGIAGDLFVGGNIDGGTF